MSLVPRFGRTETEIWAADFSVCMQSGSLDPGAVRKNLRKPSPRFAICGALFFSLQGLLRYLCHLELCSCCHDYYGLVLEDGVLGRGLRGEEIYEVSG